MKDENKPPVCQRNKNKKDPHKTIKKMKLEYEERDKHVGHASSRIYKRVSTKFAAQFHHIHFILE